MKPTILGTGSYIPARRLTRAESMAHAGPNDPLVQHPMFQPPAARHIASRDQTGVDLLVAATEDLRRQVGDELIARTELLITYNGLPDVPFLGSGATLAARLDISPHSIIDVHNGHCSILPHMFDIATMMMTQRNQTSALLCISQNAARIWQQRGVRQSAHAWLPGDGAAVILLGTEGKSRPTLLSTVIHHYPEYSNDMGITLDDGRLYWEPGTSEMDIYFDTSKAEAIIDRGSKILPDAVQAACDAADISIGQISKLITNQPNRMLLRNWSTALGLAGGDHLDTFDSYGNMFGAAAAVTLDAAAKAGKLDDRSIVVVAGFAGAGEMAGASVIEWHSP